MLIQVLVRRLRGRREKHGVQCATHDHYTSPATAMASRKFARNYERLKREKDRFRLILADFACLCIVRALIFEYEHPIFGVISCKFL